MLPYNYYVSLVLYCLIEQVGGKFPDLDQAFSCAPMKSIPARIGNKVIHFLGGKHRNWVTHSFDICIILGYTLTAICYRLYSVGYFMRADFRLTYMMILAFFSGWISHLVCDMFTAGGVYSFGILCIILKIIGKIRRVDMNEVLYNKFGKPAPKKEFKFLVIKFVPYKVNVSIIRIISFIGAILLVAYGYLSYRLEFMVVASVPLLIAIGIGSITEEGTNDIIFRTGDSWEKFFYNIIVRINTILGIVAIMFPYKENVEEILYRIIP